MSPTPLHVLLVEDNAQDAALVVAALKRDGFDLKWARAETEAEFLARLREGPDLVLSDYSLPQFTGLRALQLVRQLRPDLPFILLSGTIGEEIAVEAMRLGATDYLLKDRLARLGEAVNRVLAESRRERERRESEVAQRETEARYRTLFDCAPDGIIIDAGTGHYVDANASACRMFGYTREEFAGLTAADIVAPTEVQRIPGAIASIKQGEVIHQEWKFLRKNGARFSAEVVAAVMPDGKIMGMIRDVTERKQTEEAHQAQLSELRRWHAMTLGREEHIISLKREINDLLARLGQSPRYHSPEGAP